MISFDDAKSRVPLNSPVYCRRLRRARGAYALLLGLAMVILAAGCGQFSDKDESARKAEEHTLRAAAYKGEMDAVKQLLAQGVDVNASDDRGGTALMQAAVAGNADVVELLLEHGADADAQSGAGNTALIAAASGGHADVVRMLLEADADPLIKNSAGQTALFRAAFGAHSECVVLLKTAEVEKEKPQEPAGEPTD